MSGVDQFLLSIGLEQYQPLFDENDIDATLLADLTTQDLKEIGIVSLGHRKKILAAVDALAKANSETERDNTGTTAQRREVTTLFADLTAYTRLSRELETEDLHNILSDFYDEFDDIVADFGGTVERHIGDCVMAVFGAPVSHDNDAERALRAALTMHDAMEGISSRFGRLLTVHIGVAGGNVLFSREGRGSLKALDFSLTGDSVNLAARLADQAESGETLITERIHNTLGDHVECDRPGHLDVKGFETPVAVHRFLGFRERAAIRPLVGRANETRAFTRCIDDCLEDKHGQLVIVSGEAGLGKSRLIDEFEQIAESKGFEAHKTLVLDFGHGAAQTPLRTLLRGLCGITKNSDAGQVKETIALLRQRDIVGDRSIPFLTLLLGAELDASDDMFHGAMTDEVRRDGQSRALRALISGRAFERPLLFILEDLHWADTQTLEAAALIAAETALAPIVCLMTTRPENDPLNDSWWALAGRPARYKMDLAPLSADDAVTMALQSADAPAEDVIRACVARAEGNPLFLDQLIRHAREEGFDTVPGSIQSIVQARLDKLSLVDRGVLEAAAILGQQFTIEEVIAILDIDECDETPLLDALLIRMVQQGYLFAHALIRDAVLRTILRDNLRTLHLKAAALFESIDPVLHAEHLGAAQDPTAAAAFLRAAETARSGYNKASALSLTEKGLEFADEPDTTFNLLHLKGEMLRDLGNGQAAIAAFEAALNVSERPQDVCRAQIGVIAAMRIIDRIDDAYALLDEVEVVAKTAELYPLLSEIHYFRGNLHFPRGDLEGCLEEHAKSLEYAQKAALPERRALALSGLGDAHYGRGQMFTAHAVIEECLALCDEHGLIAVEAANRFMLATVKIYMNQTERALEEALSSASIAERVGQARPEIVSRLTAAWILVSMGRVTEAQQQIEQGLRLVNEIGAKRFEPFLEETLATCALVSDQRETAEQIAEGALAKARDRDAMSFIGPWLLSTVARATSSVTRRQQVLAEGEAILAKGCVGHNYYRFYRNAIEANMAAADWSEARRYADLLAAYTAAEPTPWSDYFVRRARAIADAYEGTDATSTLSELRTYAASVELTTSTVAIDRALNHISEGLQNSH